ncbi:hypothetical protein ACRRTK_001464 [Alexandromys fortis]
MALWDERGPGSHPDEDQSHLDPNTHSLSCDVIVKARTTPGQSWCEGQCSVDGVPFLQYDNDNKATPLGDLGKVADATPVWTDLMQKLEYLGQELRKMLANSIQEMTETSGSTSRATGITLLTSASAAQPPLTTKLQYEEVFVPIAAFIAIILPLIVGIVVKSHPQGDSSLHHSIPESSHCITAESGEETMEMAVTKLIYCHLILLLTLLPVCLCAGLDDTYYIYFNFTIKARSKPWFEGQCSVNGEPILRYNESNFTPLGDHGKVIYNTKACTDFSQRQKDIGEEMKNLILNMKREADKIIGPHTVQVTMESRYEKGELTDSSWKFTMDGQNFFCFSPKNKTWGVMHEEARGKLRAPVCKEDRDLLGGRTSHRALMEP